MLIFVELTENLFHWQLLYQQRHMILLSLTGVLEEHVDYLVSIQIKGENDN